MSRREWTAAEIATQGEGAGWYDPVYQLAAQPDLGEDVEERLAGLVDAAWPVHHAILQMVLCALWGGEPFDEDSPVGEILSAAFHVAFKAGWMAATASSAGNQPPTPSVVDPPRTKQ